LPDILKAFSKAAIRERPKDLHLWSAEYFSRLSKIRSRPVDYQLTYGSLEMLYNKAGFPMVADPAGWRARSQEEDCPESLWQPR
jgi:hypothetical protein